MQVALGLGPGRQLRPKIHISLLCNLEAWKEAEQASYEPRWQCRSAVCYLLLNATTGS